MSHIVLRHIVAYLRDTYEAVLPSTVAVSVGTPPGGDVPDKYVAVAYGGDDRAGITSVEFIDEGQNTGEFTNLTATIWCTISTASGDQDALAQMDITQGLYDLCAAAIDSDWKFGGLLSADSTGSLSSSEWVIEDGGQVATLFFGVSVQARWLR